MIYQPAFDPLPQPEAQFTFRIQTGVNRSGLGIDQIRAGFLDRLEAVRTEELARGITTIGPTAMRCVS